VTGEISEFRKVGVLPERPLIGIVGQQGPAAGVDHEHHVVDAGEHSFQQTALLFALLPLGFEAAR
jgi:hypothetical protein